MQHKTNSEQKHNIDISPRKKSEGAKEIRANYGTDSQNIRIPQVNL